MKAASVFGLVAIGFGFGVLVTVLFELGDEPTPVVQPTQDFSDCKLERLSVWDFNDTVHVDLICPKKYESVQFR